MDSEVQKVEPDLHDDPSSVARKRFRKAILMVIINNRISRKIEEKEDTSHMLTFEVFHEMEDDDSNGNESTVLTFNKHYFKSQKEAKLTSEVKSILRRPMRTEEELKTALTGLQTLSSFTEYPLYLQEKLVRVAFLFSLPSNRVIIRQGHRAETFYFLIHGTAIESSVERDSTTGEDRVHLKRVLRKGDCFGDSAMLYGTNRTTTITSNSSCELLFIDKDDFLEIFLMVDKLTNEPAHVAFTKSLPFMEGWPVEKLVEQPKLCLAHFYRKDEVIVSDSNNSKWMYIMKSGSCRVELTVNRGPRYIKKKKTKADRYMYLASKGMRAYSKVDHRWKNKFEFLTQKDDGKHEEGISASVPEHKQKVLVQIDELFSKDIFGLAMLCEELRIIHTEMPSLQLISKGAECILLQKQFFLQHLSSDHKKALKTLIKPYPDLEDIQNHVRDHLNWKLFKEKTVMDILAAKKH
ncbi:uncharacterized protein [Antedon mediterranea]|uniref:uncharacterized protein n=1 Tax=Antedon mediterranea TaxID=105859 RepID=UPI003AF94BF0